MRATKVRHIATAILCLGMMTLFSSCPVGGIILVAFNDPALEAIIANKLGLRLTPVTTVDMLRIKSLDISGVGIFDLTGLEHAKLMTYLDASSNGFSDISPLASCVSLRTVNLADTDVFEISALEGLIALRTVNVCGNTVPNLQPLIDNTSFVDAGATDSASSLTVDCELVTGDGFDAQLNIIGAGQDQAAMTPDDNIIVLCNCEED